MEHVASKQLFESEQDAAFAVLRETTTHLRNHKVDFVVVGGWVPYLFHQTVYKHPGTFDVDILLSGDSLTDGSFSHASEALFELGYLRAAKNQFQAHRLLNVNGEEVIFHVDFLNEVNQESDVIDIVVGKGRIRSIYTPAMRAIFRHQNFRFTASLPEIKFPSVETFIASKAAALSSQKRTRDAFDIFVSAHDQNAAQLETSWTKLMNDGLFVDANETIRAALEHGGAVEKISRIIRDSSAAVPSEQQILNAFSFVNVDT